jgi:hypothetical protein
MPALVRGDDARDHGALVGEAELRERVQVDQRRDVVRGQHERATVGGQVLLNQPVVQPAALRHVGAREVGEELRER